MTLEMFTIHLAHLVITVYQAQALLQSGHVKLILIPMESHRLFIHLRLFIIRQLVIHHPPLFTLPRLFIHRQLLILPQLFIRRQLRITLPLFIRHQFHMALPLFILRRLHVLLHLQLFITLVRPFTVLAVKHVILRVRHIRLRAHMVKPAWCLILILPLVPVKVIVDQDQ